MTKKYLNGLCTKFSQKCHDAAVIILICLDFLTVHQQGVSMRDIHWFARVQQHQLRNHTQTHKGIYCFNQVAGGVGRGGAIGVITLAGFSTRFFWGHVAGECPWPATSKPLTCHTQTLDLPHPNFWPATPEALDLPRPNPRPATRKPLATPKALDPPHVAGLTTCVFWFCLFYF